MGPAIATTTRTTTSAPSPPTSPPSSASMASRTTNAQCVIYMRIVWPGLTQGVDTSMVISVIEFSKEGYKIKNNLS